jgi:hypothetical protein
MKGLVACIVAVPIACLLFAVAISLYDYRTRVTIQHAVTEELPTGASTDQMRHFLERHTDRFSMNAAFRPEVGGFAPRTNLDKWLFDRSVQIVLKLDSQHRFASAEVNID